MSITKEEAVKALHESEYLFVAYSQATRLPYVLEDEETANDQVWIFSAEEDLKAYGQKKLEDKILLMGMRFEKKDFPRLYGTFFLIGANAIVWNAGGEQLEVELTDVARQADFSNLEENKRPLFNPGLQLCAIYFMQEVRRPVKPEERTANLRPMEEELIANLKKSEYLVAMSTDPENEKKINIPFLKNKDGKILQPIFSDVMEFEKFAKGKKLRAAKIPFDKLVNVFMAQSEGMVLNPMGVNLVLLREQLKVIYASMGIELKDREPVEIQDAVKMEDAVKDTDGTQN